MPVRPPDGAEGDLVDASALADRRGKQRPVADELIVVDDLVRMSIRRRPA